METGDIIQLIVTVCATWPLLALVQINAAGHEPLKRSISLSLTGVAVSMWALMVGRITGEWGAQGPYISLMASLAAYSGLCAARLTILYGKGIVK